MGKSGVFSRGLGASEVGIEARSDPTGQGWGWGPSLSEVSGSKDVPRSTFSPISTYTARRGFVIPLNRDRERLR